MPGKKLVRIVLKQIVLGIMIFTMWERVASAAQEIESGPKSEISDIKNAEFLEGTSSSTQIITPSADRQPLRLKAKDFFWAVAGGPGRPSYKSGRDLSYSYSYEAQAYAEMRFFLWSPVNLSFDQSYTRLLTDASAGNSANKKSGKNESFASSAYLGYGFSDLSPGWVLNVRLGARYQRFNLLSLSSQQQEGDKKNARLKPAISLEWLYEQKNGELFFMDFAYIHYDRGNIGGDKITEYGLEMKAGESIPMAKYLAFYYALGADTFLLKDWNERRGRILRFHAVLGFSI